MNTKKITKNAIIIALYLITIQLNPIGWGGLQFRLGEVFAAIPFFNREYVPALIIGAGIVNLNSPLGLIDIAVGVSCCALTYAISKYMRNNYLKGVVYSLISAIIVSAELLYVFKLPYLWSFISIFISMLIVMTIGVKIISTNKFIRKLILE